MKDITINDPSIKWQYARSSGPGGQNVNKTETKVVLYFDISKSNVLNDEEKRLLLNVSPTHATTLALQELHNKITAGGKIIITSQESRSKEENKISALKKLNHLLNKALEKPKERKESMTKKSKVRHRTNIEKSKLIKYKQKRESF